MPLTGEFAFLVVRGNYFTQRNLLHECKTLGVSDINHVYFAFINPIFLENR